MNYGFACWGIGEDLWWLSGSSENSSRSGGRCSLSPPLAQISSSTFPILTGDLRDSSKSVTSNLAGHFSGTSTRKAAKELPTLGFPKLRCGRGSSLTQPTVQGNTGRHGGHQPSHPFMTSYSACPPSFPDSMLLCGPGRGDGSLIRHLAATSLLNKRDSWHYPNIALFLLPCPFKLYLMQVIFSFTRMKILEVLWILCFLICIIYIPPVTLSDTHISLQLSECPVLWETDHDFSPARAP